MVFWLASLFAGLQWRSTDSIDCASMESSGEHWEEGKKILPKCPNRKSKIYRRHIKLPPGS